MVGVWSIALEIHLKPFICGGSSQKSPVWQVTDVISFSFLLASRKPSWITLFRWGHSSQKGKKSKKHYYLSLDLLPSSKSCICLISTQKKQVTRGLCTLLIQTVLVAEKALGVEENAWLNAKWANKPGLSKEWATRTPTDPRKVVDFLRQLFTYKPKYFLSLQTCSQWC